MQFIYVHTHILCYIYHSVVNLLKYPILQPRLLKTLDHQGHFLPFIIVRDFSLFMLIFHPLKYLMDQINLFKYHWLFFTI